MLFVVTVFLGAGLVFAAQPMIGKGLLPLVGGAPAAWNACLMFFQVGLLAGYAGAHAAASRLGPRAHVGVHVGVGLAALVVLPLRVDPDPIGPFSAVDTPVAWLLLRLSTASGLPFVVLAATAPTVQRWLAHTGGPRAADPYALYAASNLGSLVALLGYPLLVEPQLSLALQGRAWAGGYVVVVLLLAVCGLAATRAVPARGPAGEPESAGPAGRRAAEPVTTRRRLRWIALALVPSTYLLGVTAHLVTDVAAVPLLWVIPLTLYLLSFVVVFARRSGRSHRAAARVLPALALFVVVVELSGMTLPLPWLVTLHLATFLAAALTCHGALAADRPAAARLTEYYLLLGLGGAAGGAFNALLAPVLFDRVVEYPLAIVLACLLRPAPAARAGPGARRLDVALPAALGGLAAGLALVAPMLGLTGGRVAVAWMVGLPAAICYTWVGRPARFALGLGALLLAGSLHTGPAGRPVHQERTFFGVLRVTVDPEGRFHQLVHGHTVHGRQRRGGGGPLSYYHPGGPAGEIFTRLPERAAGRRVAVIGLGAGSLCAYARAGEDWVFYEIDPAVARIARDPALFTFWRDCRAARRVVELGDARLRLAGAPDGHFDALVVDAFSSDAVPVHLVTREALALYRRKVAPGGWIVFHVSSRTVELRPPLAALARDAGWVAQARDDLRLGPEDRAQGKDPSRWLVMAGAPADLGALAEDGRWHRVPGEPGAPVWTDDFSNLWSVLRWE